MANETTMQSSSFSDQEVQETEDCCENIPPDVTLTNEASKVKAKSRISGLQSALTPILKYLNIGNKTPTPEPSKHGHSPVFRFGNIASNSNENVIQTSKTGVSSGQSVHSSDVPWLYDYLPEISLLDVTCDTTMDLTRNGIINSVPGTPVCRQDLITKPEKAFDMNLNSKVSSTLTPVCWLQDESFSEITLLDVTNDCSMQQTRTGSARSDSESGTPASAKDTVKTEDLDVNLNSKMRLTPKIERSTVQSTQGDNASSEATCDFPPVESFKNGRASQQLGDQITAESVVNQCSTEESSNTLTGNVTHIISSFTEESDDCKGGNTTKPPLDGTQDIVVASISDSIRPSPHNSGENIAEIQASAEEALEAHPVNVTYDISSTSDTSLHCHMSQSSASLNNNTSLKNVTTELNIEHVNISHPVEPDGTKLSTKSTNQNTDGSLNCTFTTVQPSKLSTSTDSNASAQISYPQNMVLDFPASNVSSPTAVHNNHFGQSYNNTCEMPPVVNQNCLVAKANETFDVQNSSSDRHSLQKSKSSIILSEAGVAPLSLQNNNFEFKPLNGTITLSETSSSDGHPKTLDKVSPNATNTTKDNSTEVHPSELSSTHSETTDGPDPNTRTADPPESSMEANQAAEPTSRANKSDTRVNSPSALPARHRLSDCVTLQGMNTESNKANTFNLDDTLDLKSESLITSTPMPTCKIFNFPIEREGKITVAQKLYGDGPSNPAGLAISEVPSNIISDRKTFLRVPTAKALLPPMKAPSQLLKYKPVSGLPMKAPPLSGLPMTRERTQAEAVKTTAVAHALRETKEISSTYNLRPAKAGLKPLASGLQKPQQRGIPSGLQRAAAGLKPPITRRNAAIFTNSEKPHLPADGANPVVKTLQPKKHILTRGETLPAAKKMKTVALKPQQPLVRLPVKHKSLKHPATSQKPLQPNAQKCDAAVPASTAQASSTCDGASSTRNLKLPATSHRAPPAKIQGHGCVNCTSLQQQLKVKSEEIRKLKEELQKYKKEEEEC